MKELVCVGEFVFLGVLWVLVCGWFLDWVGFGLERVFGLGLWWLLGGCWVRFVTMVG